MQGFSLLVVRMLVIELPAGASDPAVAQQTPLTYRPKLLFFDEDPKSDGISPPTSFWAKMEDERCSAAFVAMYANLKQQQVMNTVVYDDPCAACQGSAGNANAHCCQTWTPRPTRFDPTGGVCACDATVQGLAPLTKLCKIYRGRLVFIDGSFTGMYGESYTFVRRNVSVVCLPDPDVHCSATGVEQWLAGLAEHCVINNQRVHMDVRCTFSLGSEFMLPGEDGVMRKMESTAGNGAAGANPSLGGALALASCVASALLLYS